MLRRPRAPHPQGIHDVNMTPLIDVSLVLVVILMVATPLAFQSGIAVQQAGASGRRAAVEARTERIELALHADGTVEIDRTVVTRDQLAAALSPRLRDSATRFVVVRCDDGVTHGDFVTTLDVAKALGAAHIAIVGQ